MCCFSFSSGGGEIFPIILANGLKKRGYSITLLNIQGTQEDPGFRKKILSNIPIIYLNDNLNNIISKYSIDIVHSHYGDIDEIFAEERLINNNFRLVVTQHGMYELIKNFKEKIINRILGVDEWVYVAEKNIKIFKDNQFIHGNNFTKIFNAVDYKHINILNREDYNIPSDSFLFCIASRGIPSKGWKETIEAITRARTISGNDIHLLIVGNGQLYDSLKDKSPSFIHFVGFQHNVIDFFAMSDMGIIASNYKGESFPLAILECFQAKKPILSTNIGEIKNMIEHKGYKAGVLQELDESGSIPIDTFANKISHITSDKNFYTTIKNNVGFVSKKFDYNIMINKYTNIYNKLYTK